MIRYTIFLSLFIYPASPTSPQLEQHLKLGRLHLENHQFSDALTQFHAAIELEPNDYQILYKRALIFLALGKYHQAIKDLTEVIKLKDDFLQAIAQRGELYLKQGKLNEAHIDFEYILRRDNTNSLAINSYSTIEQAYKYKEELNYYESIKDCTTMIELLNHLIEISPWDVQYREIRSDCYLTVGETQHAISDLRFTTKLTMDNTAGYYKLSMLMYQIGELGDALKESRECLKLDPEHDLCFPAYKKMKKMDKLINQVGEAGERGDWGECVSGVKKALKVDPKHPTMIEYNLRHKLCWCYLKKGEGHLAVDHCSQALKIKEDPEVLNDRAEAYILNDLFNEAILDYTRSLEIEETQRARDGQTRAQKLLKQSKKRDYYKILGVTRSSTKKEIVKAYRKLAQKWHPDLFSGEDKKFAENKFIDIAAAKEVLTNPEKKEKFDNGEDPLDPEQQNGGQGGGFNPFHFHFQQNSGPFHFKFH